MPNGCEHPKSMVKLSEADRLSTPSLFLEPLNSGTWNKKRDPAAASASAERRGGGAIWKGECGRSLRVRSGMIKRVAKILENVKFLAPIIFVLLCVVALFTVAAGVVCDLAGYAIKIPGLILIDFFVMALVICDLFPFIWSKNERKFENGKIELAKPYSASEYFARIEQTALDILDEQKPIDRTIILWCGMDGIRLNEDGTLEWISRKKPSPVAQGIFCQSFQPITGSLLGWQIQSTRSQIDALIAQSTDLQIQSCERAQMENAIQQCCVKSPMQYPPYFYGGYCGNYIGQIFD